jgi:hypothetical protein
MDGEKTRKAMHVHNFAKNKQKSALQRPLHIPQNNQHETDKWAIISAKPQTRQNRFFFTLFGVYHGAS